MKKFVPFVFIALMAGLVGVKFAVASEAPAVQPVAQVEVQL